jgi:demethylmenaquinone methyltransferase/2-methoxy-6-polyprenyl-1,4-benzoquinol methylase
MTINMSKSNPADTEYIFSSIAQRYDLCNHLFSFGMDFSWRKKTAALCCDKPIESALDLCCGTGDMAFALARTKKVQSITACDISQPMLTLAQQKNRGQLPVSVPINWLHCPAQNTGLPEASFGLITCAFGLRNINNVRGTLTEMYRLLKPGGKVCILDFSLPQNKFIRSIYCFYLARIMPLAAGWIAGTAAPWHYLADSIRQWEQINLPQLLQAAGFNTIACHPLSFNTVQITIAQKVLSPQP